MKLRAAQAALLFFAIVQPCVADQNRLADIQLPPGFSIEVFADVPNARSLALGDDGTVFVANRRGDSVFAIILNDSNQREVIELVRGLSMPNGIAFVNGDLYVAEPSPVARARR